MAMYERKVFFSFFLFIIFFLISGCVQVPDSGNNQTITRIKNFQVYPSADGAILTWNINKDMKSVSGYLVEYRELNRGGWQSIKKNSKGVSGGIGKLKTIMRMKASIPLVEQNEYEFRVTALSSEDRVLAQSLTGDKADKEFYDIDNDGRLDKMNEIRYPSANEMMISPITDLSFKKITQNSVAIRWQPPELNGLVAKEYAIQIINQLTDFNNDGVIDDFDYLKYIGAGHFVKTLDKIVFSNTMSEFTISKKKGFNPLPERVYAFRIVSKYNHKNKNLVEYGIPLFLRTGPDENNPMAFLEIEALTSTSRPDLKLKDDVAYLRWFNFYTSESALVYHVEHKRSSELNYSQSSLKTVASSKSTVLLERLENLVSYNVRITHVSGSMDKESFFYTENIVELPVVLTIPKDDKTSPTAKISVPYSPLIKGISVQAIVQFDEPVLGFETDDMTVDGGSIVGDVFIIEKNKNIYGVKINPSSSQNLTQLSINIGTDFTDINGNRFSQVLVQSYPLTAVDSSNVLSYEDINVNQYGENGSSLSMLKGNYHYRITEGERHGITVNADTGAIKVNTLTALPVKNHTVRVTAFSKDSTQTSNPISGTLKVSINAHARYQAQSINTKDYVRTLGIGMDVDWSKITPGKNRYNRKAMTDFKNFGLNHARIRIVDRVESPDEEGNNYDKPIEKRLYEYVSTVSQKESGLDQQIKDALSIGVIPIVAYQASEFKNDPQNKNKGMDRAIDWWIRTANRYQFVSHKVAFNLIIEVTDGLSSDREALNTFYDKVIREIRKTNPKRILFMGALRISSPYALKYLRLPKDDSFIAVEWHFFATGPYGVVRYPSDYKISEKRGKLVETFWDYENKVFASPFKSKGWTAYGQPIYDMNDVKVNSLNEPSPLKDKNGNRITMKKPIGGTAYQRKIITDAIDAALEWSKEKDVPVWVGAWMPGNYNTSLVGGDFKIREQMGFAKFMSHQLKKNNIPFAVNSDVKFYNRDTNKWIVNGTKERDESGLNKDISLETSSYILRAILNPYKPTESPVLGDKSMPGIDPDT